MSRFWLVVVVITLSGLVAGCATTAPGEFTREELELRIAQNPDDWQAHRELGVLLASAEQFPRAHQSLQRAYERNQSDPRTMYYDALVSEVLGREDVAMRLFEQYPSVPASSEYRDRLQGRYLYLLRQQVRREFRQALAAEMELAQVVDGDALGVLPFGFRTGGARYEPLGRGLAEMISVDLAGVQGLRVVERVRIQTLLSELDLARTGVVDEATAPRYGRLLRANKLVGGQYGVINNQLTIDAGVFAADEPDLLPDLSTTSGNVDRLFDLQKQVVREILQELDITPSAAELARLDRVPTRSMDAFVQFSRGLQLEDEEDYERAALLYQRAATIDPGFTQAAQKAAECRAIASQAAEAQVLLVPGIAEVSEMVGRRSSRLNSTLSQHLIPGIDTRDPALEGLDAGASGPLPDPPAPPSPGQ